MAAAPDRNNQQDAASSASQSIPANSVIAIDGPAGSGKSTTARNLAARFGLLYIDTGAMYRALTWAALQAGIPVQDAAALAALLRESRLELRAGRREATVLWNGRDVSEAIRSRAVENAVSRVSTHERVRADMVERQRALGRNGGVVMEGRDIGSVVFPLATAKIYLDASLEARAERRFRQHRQRGQEVSREELIAELAQRDHQDSQRASSPLSIPPDAVVLDSSDWSLADQDEHTRRAVHTVVACREAVLARTARDLPNMPWKYRLAYHVFATVARYHGLRQVGLEGRAVPAGTIIACNHVSWWDPPMIGASLWRHPVRTLAKAELFHPAPMGALFRFLDAIPIQRKGYDTRAFGTARDALQSGQNIIIFPEGTRRPIGKPGPVRSGLGILLQSTEAPLLPAFIRGTCGLQAGGSIITPLELRYGPVVHMHALRILRERFEPRVISGQIGRLCEAIFRELQQQSYAENPPSQWELEQSERQVRKYRAKERRIFGSKASNKLDS